VGKGVGDQQNISKVLEVAALLKASLGATRPVVDLGWVPRQQQVGITGFSISPQVYIAIGISGHDNHVFGIRYAGTVISVNNSPDAPIFRYSDYGLVMDSMKFVEELKSLAERQRIQ
jgi:electron transfer flavoprotein alpha subunit